MPLGGKTADTKALSSNPEQKSSSGQSRSDRRQKDKETKKYLQLKLKQAIGRPGGGASRRARAEERIGQLHPLQAANDHQTSRAPPVPRLLERVGHLSFSFFPSTTRPPLGPVLAPVPAPRTFSLFLPRSSRAFLLSCKTGPRCRRPVTTSVPLPCTFCFPPRVVLKCTALVDIGSSILRARAPTFPYFDAFSG